MSNFVPNVPSSLRANQRLRRLSVSLLLSFLLFSLSFQSVAQNTNEVVSPASLYVNANGNNKVAGLTPTEVRHAYGFDQIANQGEGQTIGILIPFDNPNIQADLNIFNQKFGLPASAFEKQYYPANIVPVPPSSYPPSILELFQLESSLDVEWAHAIAPKARIVLVETTDKVDDLMQAANAAVASGAKVVSMSFGLPESFFSSRARQLLLDQNLSKPSVSFVAAAGDTGNYSCQGFASLCWPGTSPNVTSVGGTMLHVDSNGNYVSEEAWKGPGTSSQPGIVSGGGGGLSINEDVPDYQRPFNPYSRRAVPDVAYNANPNNGFPVYDSNPFQGSTGWQEIGGTSAGAPQWAALLAIANSIRKAAGKGTMTGSNAYLYSAAAASYSNDYHDIFAGTNTNGKCGPLCSATVGYDFVTGLGSPNAANLINALVRLP
jgi:subtilase family serine protease